MRWVLCYRCIENRLRFFSIQFYKPFFEFVDIKVDGILRAVERKFNRGAGRVKSQVVSKAGNVDMRLRGDG